MPTPPLPLFQALLDTLEIPIRPPSVSSIPPSLLLVTLERILNIKLPLPRHLRHAESQSPADELSLVKVLLGVMADDELSMDLSAIDPVRVVMGSKTEMGVMIMALVVIAKRHGIPLRHTVNSQPSSSDTEMDLMSDDTGRIDRDGLMGPLRPDITLSSPIISETTTLHGGDVFGASAKETRSGLFAASRAVEKGHHARDEDDERDYDEYESPLPHRRVDSHHDLRSGQTLDDRARRDLRDAVVFDKVTHWRDNGSSAGRAQGKRGKTVLQEMMDEFGLG